MASSLGIVAVNPSCSGDRFLRPNFSVTTSCCFSSSVYFRCWRGRSNVGTVVNPARRRHDVGGLLVSGCLSSPDSSSPPSSISGPKTKLYVSGKAPFPFFLSLCLFFFPIFLECLSVFNSSPTHE